MTGVETAIRVLVDQPEIPGNTGNLIRLAAVTGVEQIGRAHV